MRKLSNKITILINIQKWLKSLTPTCVKPMLGDSKLYTMKLFDLIKTELIGKSTYTEGNIKFKIENVFQHYDELKNHFNTKEDIKLTALMLVGKDENGNSQEVILANNRILDLFYFA